MASKSNPLVLLFGILGNIVSGLTFLAPLSTFKNIYKEKSTMEFVATPYLVALFSSMLWIYYALIKSNKIILSINVFGCTIEGMYILMYLYFAKKQNRIYTAKILGSSMAVLLSFVFVTLTTIFGPARDAVVGLVCMVFSILVFASPLITVIQVIRTKSVKYMPLLLSFSLTVNAIVWFAYGFLKKDPTIAIPNILGFILGVLQLVVYYIYNRKA